MPRFKETEKENIRQKLLIEGERLFVTHGLKKVTIDDLIGAVNIAKATFYSFYESKEYLYMDIVQDIQKKVFMELKTVLDNNTGLSGRERVRQIFNKMVQLMTHYPIISKIDQSTVDLLSRKVKKVRIAEYITQITDAAQTLYNYGVRFKCKVKIASIIFQTLYLCNMNMHIGSPKEQAVATELMLNGIINNIVEE